MTVKIRKHAGVEQGHALLQLGLRRTNLEMSQIRLGEREDPFWMFLRLKSNCIDKRQEWYILLLPGLIHGLQSVSSSWQHCLNWANAGKLCEFATWWKMERIFSLANWGFPKKNPIRTIRSWAIRVVQNSTFSKNHSSTPLLNVFRGIWCDPDHF